MHGNNKQIVFRTDGDTTYNPVIPDSPYVWMYGGDDLSNRIMYLKSNGDLYPNRCFNAVYADLAECFISDNKELSLSWINKIVKILPNGKATLAEEEDVCCIGVVSNTYGLVLNGNQDEIDSGYKIPVAMAGTVYVIAETPNAGKIGDFVCAGQEGKARITDNFKLIVGKIIEIKDNLYKILVK